MIEEEGEMQGNVPFRWPKRGQDLLPSLFSGLGGQHRCQTEAARLDPMAFGGMPTRAAQRRIMRRLCYEGQREAAERQQGQQAHG